MVNPAKRVMTAERPCAPHSSTAPYALAHWPDRSTRTSREGKHETPIIDEEDQVDGLVALTDDAPEPLEGGPRARPLDAEPRRLHRRDPPRGQQGNDHRPCLFGGDGGPMVHPEFLGLVVDPEDVPATAPVYARIAHLSAPRVTSTVKRPSPRGVMTRRPRA